MGWKTWFAVKYETCPYGSFFSIPSTSGLQKGGNSRYCVCVNGPWKALSKYSSSRMYWNSLRETNVSQTH